MEHKLKIRVSKQPEEGGIISCRTVTMREKLLTKLFGCKRKVTILIPGDSVESVSIQEIGMRGEIS